MQAKANLPYYIYRWSHNLHRCHIPLIPFVLQQFSRVMFCCLIPYKTRIGKDVHFNHLGMGIIISPAAVIGNNVKINQHVTIGGNGEGGCPIVCDNAYIGAGAKVLGPVRIGNGAKIGANAVVLCDVPDGMTAVGIPARIVQKKS
jgi:serine O-acetyltransferase